MSLENASADYEDLPIPATGNNKRKAERFFGCVSTIGGHPAMDIHVSHVSSVETM
jgi:hypothetical protein